MSRPGLILDAGGVLITEPVPDMLRFLSTRATASLDEIERFYYQELYEPLWSGQLSEASFWKRLIAGVGGGIHPFELREFFALRLTVEPVAERLAEWGQQADLALLSNHLTGWLRPLLQDYGVWSAFQSDACWISQEMGAAKPHPEAYARAVVWGEERSAVLFVDDAPRNVQASQAAGLPALLAAPGWDQQVDEWLAEQAK